MRGLGDPARRRPRIPPRGRRGRGVPGRRPGGGDRHFAIALAGHGAELGPRGAAGSPRARCANGTPAAAPTSTPRRRSGAGRTFATNGPWLTLEADGQGPGALLDVEPGRTVRVVATVTGADRIRVYDARGVVAEGADGVDFAYRVREPTYLVAEADGEALPDDLDPRGRYAHTSPVQLTVSGRSVARQEDLNWCLEWLDRLEALIREHGTDPDLSLFDLLEQARARYRSRLSP